MTKSKKPESTADFIKNGTIPQPCTNVMMKSFQETVESKIAKIESKLEMLIQTKMEERPTAVVPPAETTMESNERQYNDIHNNINTESVDDEETQRRSKNFIIHRLKETGENNDSIRITDKVTMAQFLQTIGVASEPESVMRLGKQEAGKTRSIKVEMKTELEKENVMANLSRLKGKNEEFGNISVCNDYTIEEREEIKQWVKKAREQSERDDNFIYRVRGCPTKSTLKIVQFSRKQDAQTSN